MSVNVKLRKYIFSAATILLLGVTPLATVLPAYAATTTTTHTNFFQGLVQFFADKFGLDKTQVTNALTDYKNQHKQQVQQNKTNNEKTRLDALVTKGTITSTQEQEILDEIAKLQSEYPVGNLKNLTTDERKAQFAKMQAEITAWSTSTGIDKKYLMPFGGMGMGRGMMHHYGKPTATPTP